jgi:16S rRNA C967 or C1407 C5-methylase (RsmB/RsmF family)
MGNGSSKLLKQFSDRLWSDTELRDRFIQAFDNPPPLHPCILWCEDPPLERPFAVEPPQPWQPERVDRLGLGAQPGKHPAHDRGAYYCLDFSSVFAASPLLHLSGMKTAIDVCAAPGGKSLFTWHTLQPDLLVCNEVVGKRLGTLMANLRRCQVSKVSEQNLRVRMLATQLDPQQLAQQFPQAFQLVLVDAPCSGQSLLLKQKKVPGCFHKVTLNRNANRQKRIVGNAAQLVAPQGYLLYMTCTYSLEENEQICNWLLKKYPYFQPVSVPHLLDYQSHLSDLPCYRLWPHQGLGAGAFTALFQNQNLGEVRAISREDLAAINRL